MMDFGRSDTVVTLSHMHARKSETCWQVGLQQVSSKSQDKIA